jgi:Uri superfamily endonuclease
MYQSKLQIAENQGMDPGLFHYIGAAMKAVEKKE